MSAAIVAFFNQHLSPSAQAAGALPLPLFGTRVQLRPLRSGDLRVFKVTEPTTRVHAMASLGSTLT